MKPNLFSSIAFISILVSAVLVIALHVLVPEYNPMTRAMSNYSNSRYGWMMVAAFLGFALSQFALVTAFRQIALSKWQRFGVWLLAASGVCVLIAGIFPTDNTPDDTCVTTIGEIHAVAGHLLSPFMVGAMLGLSGKIDATDSHREMQRAAFMIAVITAIMFIALVSVNSLGLQIGGIGQRIFIALVCAWLTLTSLRFTLPR